MEKSLQTDVLIVGGGPAGLLAAATSASGGAKTLLIESQPQIGYPVHTSGATALKTMLDFKIPHQYYHPILSWRICSPDNSVIFDQPEPWGCIIDVQGMYQHLAERANTKGAIILTGVRGIHPIMSNNYVVGCQAIGSSQQPLNITSKILIDASGYGADLSKQAGLHRGFNRFGVGAEYELIAPNCRQDEAVLVVGQHYAPCGYAWVFPWGNQRVRIGVGILHTDSKANPKEYLLNFLNDAAHFNINLSGYQITESHFGLVPADGSVSRLVGSGIMAVGDAAGQASLVVGEGIRLSLQAGLLAGQTAAKAIICGHYDRQSLIAYENKFNVKYHRNLKIGHGLNTGMARWDDARWNKGVQILKSVPDRLLTKLFQSEFSTFDLAWWLALRPQYWPKVIKYGLKMFG